MKQLYTLFDYTNGKNSMFFYKIYERRYGSLIYQQTGRHFEFHICLLSVQLSFDVSDTSTSRSDSVAT